MGKFLKIYGLFFIATTAIAVTNLDEKILDKNAEKISELKSLYRMFCAF